MICIKSEHFSYNRILLLSIGLWPYQQSKLVRLQTFLVIGIMISSILSQLATLTTVKCTPDLIINVLSVTLIFIIYTIKYSAFYINIHNIRYLLEELQEICNGLKNEDELAIIAEYGCIVKRISFRLIVFSALYLVVVSVQPLWSHFFGVAQMNNSQPRKTLQFMTEYFIDPEKYFYLILLHTNMAISIGAITTLGIGTLLGGYLKHVCAMFKIASYRIEQAMEKNILTNVSLKNEMIIHRKIIYAVDIHRKTIRFCKSIMSSFEGMFFLILLVSVICLSLNLFRIVQILSIENDIEEFILHLSFIMGILCYMYVMSYVMQEVMDNNSYLFETVYNIQWYVAPLSIQKMILFMLQMGTKTFTLELGGMFVPSLESAASVTSASVSYFTVLYSTWQ